MKMNSEATLNSANDFARNYDDYIRNCNWVGPVILFGLMYNYIKPGQKILDIGIGTGLGSKSFEDLGLMVYGIDGSEEMINICSTKKIAKELKQIDLTKNFVWFENTKFDHVISHGVFHLVGNLTGIFNNTSEILKKDGCFTFTYEEYSKPADDFKESSIKGIFARLNKPSGINEYRHTENYILDHLETHGLKLLKKTEFLAFIDPETKTRTYFTIVVTKKM